MTTLYSQLEPGFSTADAEHPALEHRDGNLTLQFVDWHGEQIVVRFSDAAAFRWQNDENLPPGIRDDTVYEVKQSPWIGELRDLDAITDKHRHFKLCFNANGVLDVVAVDLVKLSK